MSTRRLEPKELQRAFARGPRQDLDFLVPALGGAPAAVEASAEAPATVEPVEPAPARRRRTTRSKRSSEPKAAGAKAEAVDRPTRRRGRKASKSDPVEPVVIETPVVEAPIVEAPVVEAPVVETPIADTLATSPRVDADAPWAPAASPWPEPTLLDRALRRLERFVGRMLCAA